MVIDSHHHFWNYDPVSHAWIDDSMQVIRKDFSGSELYPELEANGIDGTVLVQVNQTDRETRQLMEWADEYKYIKGVVGWIDLADTRIADRLSELKTNAMLKGFRHIVQAEEDDSFLKQPQIIRGIKALGSFGFTYDILITPKQLKAATDMAQQCDNQAFVLDHIAKPYIRTGEMNTWKRDIIALSEYENVMCKLSGIITEAHYHSWTYEMILPYLEVVLEAFGPHRLMFGSDWPVCLVAGTYKEVLALVLRFIQTLSASERDGITAGNAVKFYDLQA